VILWGGLEGPGYPLGAPSKPQRLLQDCHLRALDIPARLRYNPKHWNQIIPWEHGATSSNPHLATALRAAWLGDRRAKAGARRARSSDRPARRRAIWPEHPPGLALPRSVDDEHSCRGRRAGGRGLGARGYPMVPRRTLARQL